MIEKEKLSCTLHLPYESDILITTFYSLLILKFKLGDIIIKKKWDKINNINNRFLSLNY